VRYNRTSASQEVAQQVLLFPNPLETRTLGIRLEGFHEAAKVSFQLFDMTGRKIVTSEAFPTGKRISDEFLDLPSQLSSGLYIVKITDGNKVFNKRIILK